MNSNPGKEPFHLREDAFLLVSTLLQAIKPENLVKSCLENKYSEIIEEYARIKIFGAGKACAQMALAIFNLYPEKIVDSLLIVPDGYAIPDLLNIKEAAHPIPDQRGFAATEELINKVKATSKDELIIFVFSGGGSALLTYPYPPLTLEHLIVTNKELLNCGANIIEINTIRKHLSWVQGGRLGKLVRGNSLTLLLSDVIGNDMSSIASGPTVKDPTTYHDAWKIIEKYQLGNRLPVKVLKFLKEGQKNLFLETPKELPEKQQNYLIGTNSIALNSAFSLAQKLGYKTIILTSNMEGEARLIGKMLARIAMEIKIGNPSFTLPVCILAGGETTVKVTGMGKGGRNQELALSAGLELQSLDNVLILSLSTDGKDGPTDAAGAYVDAEVMNAAKIIGLPGDDFLNDNNSFPFFYRSGGLLKTDPTFTNVGDIMIMLVG